MANQRVFLGREIYPEEVYLIYNQTNIFAEDASSH